MTRFIQKLILSGCLFGILVPAMAEDYRYLTIKRNDGNEASVSLQPLKLTFTNGKLQLFSAEGVETMELNTLTSMWLSTAPTSIKQTSGDRFALQIEDKSLFVRGIKGNTLTLYDVQGIPVRSAKPVNGIGKLDISGLSPGIYLLKTQSQTLKFSL
jgi:hypothetical protein